MNIREFFEYKEPLLRIEREPGMLRIISTPRSGNRGLALIALFVITEAIYALANPAEARANASSLLLSLAVLAFAAWGVTHPRDSILEVTRDTIRYRRLGWIPGYKNLDRAKITTLGYDSGPDDGAHGLYCRTGFLSQHLLLSSVTPEQAQDIVNLIEAEQLRTGAPGSRS